MLSMSSRTRQDADGPHIYGAGYRGDHDPLLANWEKREEPFLAYPPADMGLVGWRDPFIFEFKGQGGKEEWGMLLGSGTKGKGGAVLIYRSDSLYGGARAISAQPPMADQHLLSNTALCCHSQTSHARPCKVSVLQRVAAVIGALIDRCNVMQTGALLPQVTDF